MSFVKGTVFISTAVFLINCLMSLMKRRASSGSLGQINLATRCRQWGVRWLVRTYLKNNIRAVRKFAKFLGRSPDTATDEDLRRFQLHLIVQGTSLNRPGFRGGSNL